MHEAVGVAFNTRVVADPAPLCKRWIQAGRPGIFRHIRCMLSTAAELTDRQGKCCFHTRNALCQCPRQPADLLTCGIPCQPFSIRRGDRNMVSPQKHPDFETMLAVLRYVGRTRVHGGICECVMGMACHLPKNKWKPLYVGQEKPYSWASYFEQELIALGHCVRVLKITNEFWCDVPRVRRTTTIWKSGSISLALGLCHPDRNSKFEVLRVERCRVLCFRFI